MSVVAHSPYTGSKRLFDDSDHHQLDSQQLDTHKRSRGCGSPAGLYQAVSRASAGGSPFHQQHSSQAGVLNALRALFPGMDDQTLTTVLAQCGSDIDAAIRRLNELRLGAEQAAAADAAQTGAGSTAGTSTAAPAGEQQGQQQAQEQQQPQQQQQSAPPPEQPAGPQTADEWTDALVAEMAAARDLPDAKARAAKALTAFEQFVTTRVAGEQQRKAGNASGAGGRLEEVLRENAILKRAVQIQNARMQEAGARDAEVAALTATVAQYQERMRSLELSNYSLALHLSKATDGSALQPGHRPPDVF